MALMLRLTAPVSQPYRLAVRAAATDTGLQLTVTDPLGVAGAPVATVAAGDVRTASWTPAMSGSHTVTISGSANITLNGLQMTVDVSARGLADWVFDPSQADPATGLPTGARVRWPCPRLSALPCITAWSIDPLEYWLNVATDELFTETCRRFPGVQSYVKLRPVARSSCLIPIRGTYGIDLWPKVRYPILELVDVEQDGASIGTAGFRIEEQRYLVPDPSQSWPSQNLAAADGAAGTWSVTVRYGRVAPPLAVTARDRYAYSMLVDNEPTTAGNLACALPGNTTQVVEDGRTMVFDVDPEHGAVSATAVQAATKKWRCRRRGPRLFDPAERSALDSDLLQVVTGDPTPTDRAIWLASGCDLAAILAALGAP